MQVSVEYLTKLNIDTPHAFYVISLEGNLPEDFAKSVACSFIIEDHMLAVQYGLCSLYQHLFKPHAEASQIKAAAFSLLRKHTQYNMSVQALPKGDVKR